ncbi:hypothetical protein Q3G72_005364 [Acer saccharum]|nr:hypothetical protein Q3G72_005364 [Acer saccharum]
MTERFSALFGEGLGLLPSVDPHSFQTKDVGVRPIPRSHHAGMEKATSSQCLQTGLLAAKAKSGLIEKRNNKAARKIKMIGVSAKGKKNTRTSKRNPSLFRTTFPIYSKYAVAAVWDAVCNPCPYCGKSLETTTQNTMVCVFCLCCGQTALILLGLTAVRAAIGAQRSMPQFLPKSDS